MINLNTYLELPSKVDFIVDSLWDGDRYVVGHSSDYEHVISPSIFFAPVYRYLDPNTVWLAGGSVVRWLEGERSNAADFDLFSSNPEVLRDLLNDKLIPLNESFLSYTFETESGDKVQVIKRPYPTLIDVLKSFDFHARMVGTDGNMLIASSRALKDIRYKKITPHEGDFSLTTTSLYGVAKYANRGYTLTHGGARDFLKAWGVTLATDQPY
jgi:hypothetical protein